MKDLLKRISIGIISGGFIGYIAYLFFSSKIIVSEGFLEFNTLYYSILAIVGIYLFVLFAIHPIYMKINKVSLFVLGIALVLIGDSVLINNIESYVYISDLVKILGSFLVVLAWTNFFVSAKAKKEKEESKLEIIEV
ncbi:hypothetical protein P148_SR1C00001G1014 [candidate division SR1 bacterium RAAC1_SR1_1]|nr:hypothetical protein P148_SR1C00001G1014 [candidate division SR1 bacterium RAAC1_SR1_1]